MARDRDARIIAMAASGIVTGKIETGFNGQLRTLSIRAAIEIRRNRSKSADLQPDYRIYSDGAEIGAGWIRYSELSEKTYVSLNRSEEHTSELQSLMRISYAVYCLDKKRATQHVLKHHKVNTKNMTLGRDID